MAKRHTDRKFVAGLAALEPEERWRFFMLVLRRWPELRKSWWFGVR